MNEDILPYYTEPVIPLTNMDNFITWCMFPCNKSYHYVIYKNDYWSCTGYTFIEQYNRVGHCIAQVIVSEGIKSIVSTIDYIDNSPDKHNYEIKSSKELFDKCINYCKYLIDDTVENTKDIDEFLTLINNFKSQSFVCNLINDKDYFNNALKIHFSTVSEAIDDLDNATFSGSSLYNFYVYGELDKYIKNNILDKISLEKIKRLISK